MIRQSSHRGFTNLSVKSGCWGILLALSLLLPAGARAAFTSISQVAITATVTLSTSPVVLPNSLCSDVAPGTKILPPTLTPDPISEVSGESPNLQITGAASAQGCVQNVTLFYRKTFDTSLNTLSVTLPADVHSTTFSFTVPPELVTSEGVMLQLVTVDMSSNTVMWPTSGYALVNVSGYAKETIGAAGGVLFVPNPFERSAGTSLVFPPGALSDNTVITARELNPSALPNSCVKNNGTTPVTVFDFGPSGTIFKRPVTLNMLYPDRDRDGTIDGTDKDQKFAQLYLCTDAGWESLGGKVNGDTKVVTSRILHFSVYGVFPTTPLAPEDYRPQQRIITPGRADGQNDQAVFGFMGPDMRIEIMDSTGQRVRTLQSTNIWDGRDDQGKIVESGVYIYQFVKDGKRVSGAIAVAK